MTGQFGQEIDALRESRAVIPLRVIADEADEALVGQGLSQLTTAVIGGVIDNNDFDDRATLDDPQYAVKHPREKAACVSKLTVTTPTRRRSPLEARPRCRPHDHAFVRRHSDIVAHPHEPFASIPPQA